MAGENQFVSRVPAGGWASFLPAGIVNRVCDYFVYGANFLPLPASGSLQVDISIQNDSNFVILAAFAVVTATDNTTFLAFPGWPFTVELNDAGAGRLLQNQAQAFGNVFGTANNPLPWLQPKFIRAGSTFSTRLANLSATDRNIRVGYVGAKVFGF